LSSVHSIHEGSIAAKPFEPQSGRVTGAHGHHHHHGRAHAAASAPSTPLEGDASTENAVVAELSNLMASLQSLSSQAQSLPLNAPAPSQVAPGQGYRPQLTDYGQLAGDAQ